MEADSADGLELYAIVTVREGGATLNLAAPLLVNAAAGRGAQVILDQGNHTTREPLPAPPKG